MSVKILIRRGTAAEWTAANPILASGEFGYETDTKKLKIGNGTSAWSALAYAGAEDVIPASAITARGQLITGSDSADFAVLSIGSAGTFVVEDPVAGTLTYQGVALNDLSDASTSGAVTNDLFARGSSQWEKQSFSTALTASEETVRSVIANGDPRKGVSGYFATTATVYKWAFPADTVSTTTAAPANLSSHAGFANPAVAGYFSRGLDGSFSPTTTVYKWTFPADTVTTTNAAPAGMNQHTGFANPAVAGYFSRGDGSATVYKWAFPADTVTTTTAAPAAMRDHAGFANPAVAGYFSEGTNAASIYKWSFPADTVSTTTAAPNGTNSNAGFSNPAVAGYFSRGFGSSYTSSTTVYKWAFPADTVSTTTSAPAGMSSHAGFSNPAVAGYFNQGGNLVGGSGTPTNVVYKWAFPADVSSTTVSAPETIYANAGFANA
jgi:hypothetical protein